MATKTKLGQELIKGMEEAAINLDKVDKLPIANDGLYFMRVSALARAIARLAALSPKEPK